MSKIKNIVIELHNLQLELRWLQQTCPENTSDIQILKDKINKLHHTYVV
jgi:hypothetical protein